MIVESGLACLHVPERGVSIEERHRQETGDRAGRASGEYYHPQV